MSDGLSAFVELILCMVLVAAVTIGLIVGLVHLGGASRSDVHHSGTVRQEVSGRISHDVTGQVAHMHLHAGTVQHVHSIDPVTLDALSANTAYHRMLADGQAQAAQLYRQPRMVIDATPRAAVPAKPRGEIEAWGPDGKAILRRLDQ